MSHNPFGRQGWTPARVGDLTGQTIAITGANSGIGLEATKVLAAHGATLLLLCRNPTKAEVAMTTVRAGSPDADLTFIPLDLADLDSVRSAAAAVREKTDRLHALVNNAGIMMLPTRESTAQGFETQLGVNHLAHFALAGLLADLVEAASGRFVVVSSAAHKGARSIDFDDLNWEKGYGAVKAYCRSKLANLLFQRELNRRLEAAGHLARAYACHPGYANTNLQTTGPGGLWKSLMRAGNNLVAQSAERGSWPTLLCITSADAKTDAWYGPTGLMDMRGPVGECAVTAQADDATMAAKLWDASAALTGVTWSI